MNSRPDCKPYETPSSSCDPCLQILAHYFRQPIFPHRMMVGRYILQVWIFICWGMTSSLNIHVLGNDIKIWFALLPMVDLGLLENFINFRFLQIFNSWCFPTVMAKQHRTYWLLDRNLVGYVFLWEPEVSEFESHHYHELYMCQISFICAQANFYTSATYSKPCFKVNDREIKEERGTMHFQIEVNLIFTFSRHSRHLPDQS